MPFVGDFTSPAAIKVSTNVPDGQSGPVAVKVFNPPGANSTCSVMVKGTCEAARAGPAAPMQASTPATAASLNMRYITYPQTERMAYSIGRDSLCSWSGPIIAPTYNRAQVPGGS